MKPTKSPQAHSSANLELAPSLTQAVMQDLTTLLQTYPEEFRNQYLLDQVFSKYVGPDTDPAEVRRQRAIDKWLATELHNADTNHRLVFCEDDELIAPNIRFGKFIDVCRRVVGEIFFDSPTFEALFGTFSGGASTSKSRRQGSPALKFLDEADATESCWEALQPLVADSPLWDAHIRDTWQTPRFVDGNVMFTVPKNTTIDRVAAKEPDLNMFAQKGIGNLIRRRLRKRGINLNDQSINQRLAKIGSSDNSLATLDLSSASDSICTRLVWLLLPVDWFLLLDSIRSVRTEIDGEWHENHMFSSMGNGFTFELESMIFWALARTTAYLTGTRGTISVYGDDIIVPSTLSSSLIEVLSFFGFSTNVDKSFTDGPFRESCGAHWYSGYDVTPFYLKHPIEKLTDLILFLNKMIKWSSLGYGLVDPRFEPFIRKYLRYVPQDLWGGQDYSADVAVVTGHAPRKVLFRVTRTVSRNHIGGYLFWLRSAYLRSVVTEPIVTSEEAYVTGLCRVKRNMQAVSDDLPFPVIDG